MADGSIEALLASLDRAVDSAVSTGDKEALERLLADDFSYTHSAGLTQPKSEYIDLCLRLANSSDRQISGTKVDLHDDVAVCRGDLDIIHHDGRPTSYMRYVRIWRRFGDGWRAISSHTLYGTDRKPN